jgi:sucrose-6-phosphate hydrolase SacC (GH32 family)
MRVFPNPYTSSHEDETEIFRTTHYRDIPVHSAPLHLEEDDLLKLDIFVDYSIIEVFANNRQLITSRVYPTKVDSKDVYVFSEGGDAWAHVIHAWDMKKAGVVK